MYAFRSFWKPGISLFSFLFLMILHHMTTSLQEISRY